MMKSNKYATDIPCWCNAKYWDECFRTKTFGLVRCKRCGCYRIDPPPITSDNDSKSFYTHYYDQSKLERANPSKNYASRFWDVAAQEPYLRNPLDRVIDVGCGDGHLCNQLNSAGWRDVIGIDISTSRIARARAQYPQLSFFDKPLTEIGVKSGSVDLIILDNVIEHLPNPVSFLLDLRPYLAPKGQIVIITPNMESGNFKLLRQRWTPELAPHTHIFLFTQDSIYRCLRNAKFTTLKQGTFHTPMDSVMTLINRLIRGDIKGGLWKTGQEMGNLASRFINSGSMLYAIAKPEVTT